MILLLGLAIKIWVLRASGVPTTINLRRLSKSLSLTLGEQDRTVQQLDQVNMMIGQIQLVHKSTGRFAKCALVETKKGTRKMTLKWTQNLRYLDGEFNQTSSENCPEGWKYFHPTSSCYYFSKTGYQLWSQAQWFCTQSNGDLLTIKSESERV